MGRQCVRVQGGACGAWPCMGAAVLVRHMLPSICIILEPPPTHLQHLLPVQADEVLVNLLHLAPRLLAPQLLMLLQAGRRSSGGG